MFFPAHPGFISVALGALLLSATSCSPSASEDNDLTDSAQQDSVPEVTSCPRGCDDGNPCTDDACDAVKGCVNTPLDDISCPLSDLCAAMCEAGQCVEKAEELCDGVDNTCDDEVDEGFPDTDEDGQADCVDDDDDNDGWEDSVDCAPLDPSHHPGLPEICDNGLDDNCNGQKDGQDPACTLDFKLVLYLPFDEIDGVVSPDAAGGGHDATFVNGPGLAPGRLGMGLSLDGFDDFVKLPDPPDLEQGPARSVSIWFKAPKDWRRRMLFHQEDTRDLNQDGYPDIIISNHRDNVTWDMDSYVYWGAPWGFDKDNRTELPTSGASGQTAVDINKDGYMDLVTSNFYDSFSFHIDSAIFWGSAQGLDPDNRTAIPTIGATGNSVVDMNRDGWWDIVFAHQGDNVTEMPPSIVYWGGPDGFSEDNSTLLPTAGASANSIFDLNNDGHFDIVFAVFNKGTYPPGESLIYWGSPEGFQADNFTGLPTKYPLGNSVADMNCDGYLDITFSNYFYDGSYNVDSQIFWGSPEGFFAEDCTDLPGHGGSADSVADVNGDGWHDFLLTNFYDDVSWTLDSYIYWGSPDGYSPDNKQGLLTRGSAGNSVGDLNHDGHPDIVWGNNRVDETIIVFDTYIFWGSAEGFSNENFTGLPSQNVHGVSIAGSALNAASSAHGTQPSDYGSFEIYLQDGKVVFALTDFHHDRRELKTPCSSEEWHHVAAVYYSADKGMTLYLDGEQAAVLETPIVMGATFPWRVRVGADSENQNRLAGMVDEVRVYDRAISASEVAFLFASPPGKEQ